MGRGTKVLGLAATVLLAGVLAGCQPRPDLVVTKFTDTNDGRCDADCSLREAVVAANAAAGADVIRMESSAFLTRQGSDEDASRTGDLDVRGDLVIEASGEPTPEVFAGELDDRALDVHTGTVEVRGIRFYDGDADNGGLVRNQSRLTLVDVLVRGGTAEASGGGVASGSFSAPDASLTLVRTTVDFNRNTEEGAGVRSIGRLRIADSVIADNRGGPGYGMGIETRGDAEIRGSIVRGNGGGSEDCGGGIANGGTLVIRNSRISDNGGGSGGGVLNRGGTLTVVGSQVRYNDVIGSGGGVVNDGGRVLLDATTVAGNQSDTNGEPDFDCPGNDPDEGGGLFNSADGTFALRNTVVAYNDDGAGTGTSPDCFGTFVDRGGNTVADPRGCTLTPA